MPRFRPKHAAILAWLALEVQQITVAGGGHTWPGGPQYLPRFVIGRTSLDFDATEAIWGFLRRHTRGSTP